MVYEDMQDVVFRTAAGKWTLRQCLQCDCYFLSPRPNMETIGQAYSDYYTHIAHDQPIVRRIGPFRTFLHDLINGYLNHRYGTRRAPQIGWGSWVIPLIPLLRAASDVDFRHLPKQVRGGGDLLDIGCGDGGFLLRAAETGWRVRGVEPDLKAVATCQGRGIDATLGGTDVLSDMADRSFDYITASHVIEHVHNPRRMVKEAFRLLRPGGTFWLETPNLESLGHRRYGRFWRDLDAPRHLVLFNRASLKGLLHECGFTDVVQLNHTLQTFPIFAASEAIMRGDDAFSATRGGKPPLRDLFAEIYEFFLPRRREFITFKAVRPCDDK